MIRELILNIILWPLIHLAVSKWSLHRSNYSFDYSRGIYRLFNFERTGRFYRHYVKVTSWKRRLPDGAKWLGHDFIKEAANLRDAAHVERFLRETCRSEWAHWVTLMYVPIFFIWNPL